MSIDIINLPEFACFHRDLNLFGFNLCRSVDFIISKHVEGANPLLFINECILRWHE